MRSFWRPGNPVDPALCDDVKKVWLSGWPDTVKTHLDKNGRRVSFFDSVSSIATRGYNWGCSAAAGGWRVSRDPGATIIKKATDGL